MAAIIITEGWTKELKPFTLSSDGAGVDLTGFTVTLVLKNNAGTVIDTTADTRIDADQTTNAGVVYYKPDADDLVALGSPYTLHWKVTDSFGDVVFFPSGQADILYISKQ